MVSFNTIFRKTHDTGPEVIPVIPDPSEVEYRTCNQDAFHLCRDAVVEPIEGGGILLYFQAVDPAHRRFRWWLHLHHRLTQ